MASGPRASGIAAALALGAGALAVVSLGVAWTGANLGDVPHYGDSIEYLSLAESGRVDQYRGFLYPALLRAAGSALGARPWAFRFEARERAAALGCDAPAALAAVQLGQLALGAGLLAYFLYVLLPGLARPAASGHERTLTFAALLALLLTDPLIGHFQLTILTDGLALGGALAFCAALADTRLRRTPPWLAAAMLLLGFALCAGLRVEKRWLLLATAAATVALWWALDRGRPGARPARAALRVAAPVAAGLLLVLAGQQARFADQGRWPLATSLRHERIVFQNLRHVHAQLPERVKRVLPLPLARHYDRRISNARAVMAEVGGGDPLRLESLTRDMTAVVLRERWPQLLLDVAGDAAENLLATGSFYARLLAWRVLGDRGYYAWSRSEGTSWTVSVLSMHHPALSAAWLAAGAALFLLALPAALAAARGAWRAGGIPRERWLPFAPLLIFCAGNALLFALVADLVHIRYALPSHAVILVLVLAAALRALAAGRRSGSAW